MTTLEHRLDVLIHRIKLLPGIRQIHTRIVKAYVPDDNASEAFKDALYEWKYGTKY